MTLNRFFKSSGLLMTLKGGSYDSADTILNQLLI